MPTSAVVSPSEETGSTLAFQAVMSSSCNGNADAERKVIVAKVTGPAAGSMTGTSTPPCLCYSQQASKQGHTGLNVLPALYAELLP